MDGLSSWVRVGSRVVCVETFSASPYAETLPVKGEVYTIREVAWCGLECGVHLREIENPVREYMHGWSEAYFSIDGFRPLITRSQEQDVALFAPLLDTSRAREGADA